MGASSSKLPSALGRLHNVATAGGVRVYIQYKVSSSSSGGLSSSRVYRFQTLALADGWFIPMAEVAERASERAAGTDGVDERPNERGFPPSPSVT